LSKLIYPANEFRRGKVGQAAFLQFFFSGLEFLAENVDPVGIGLQIFLLKLFKVHGALISNLEPVFTAPKNERAAGYVEVDDESLKLIPCERRRMKRSIIS
jgi:hypothetical protein